MKQISWLSFSLATFACLIPAAAQAQVTPDGTTSTTVNQEGNNFTIEQGDRLNDNLFHSFNEFSVPTLGSATFNNAGDIANIFSRVTGSSISNIDGILGANGTANLYLINPNGIIFGENASLNLGGSFFASTADSLLFEGNTEFSAVNPQAAPLLEVSIPTGLSFRDNPAPIDNLSAVRNDNGEFVGLEVAPENNLTLVGGDINLDFAEATASGGRIELGGLSEAGIVGINEDGILSFSENVALADINFTDLSIIDVRGIGGGNIIINARNLNLEQGAFIISGLTTDSTSANAQAGDITINATENIAVNNSSIINQVNGIGNAGNISISADNLAITEGGWIDASNLGEGNAGIVQLDISDTVQIDGEDMNGFFSRVSSRTGEIGNAGNINISTTNLFLTNEGLIDASNFSAGNAGDVNIVANNTLELSNSAEIDVRGAGGGNININTGNLSLTTGEFDNSFIRAGISINSISTEAQAGNITIDAENITIDDSFISNAVAGIGDVVAGIGNAGNINIETGTLSVINGGQIDASTFGFGNAGSIDIMATDNIVINGDNSESISVVLEDSPIVSSRIAGTVSFDAEGDAGKINIETGTLSLINGGQVTTTAAGGENAGSIDIIATDTINIDGRNSDDIFDSSITSEILRLTEGDAGNIDITTSSLYLSNAGRISTNISAGTGNAGLISINASDSITIDGEVPFTSLPSSISSINILGDGNAGSVDIRTSSLILNNGGQVSTSTLGIGDAGLVNIFSTDTISIDGENSNGNSSSITSVVGRLGDGNGGNINIGTSFLSLTNGGQVSATTEGQGNAGNVTINAIESVTVSGMTENNTSGIFASAQVDNGVAGSINVSANQLTVDDSSIISVSSEEGLAGNLNITANSLFQNRGNITSETRLSQGNTGANINLEISDTWQIENESLVSATAFGVADGGNININQDTPDTDFLLFAFPPMDSNGSDIIANAEQGDGGRIDITAAGIFGIEFRDEQTPLNDFTVSSEFGTSGETIINRTVEDPTKGLINLPASVGDASDQISQNPCQQGVGSQFIVTGKGGLPPSINESLNSESAKVGLIEPLLRRGDGKTERRGGKETGREKENIASEFLPAMGWVFNDKGEVTLTAYLNSNAEIERSQYSYPICSNRS